MSKNIDQVYIANPITSNASTDLMYFGQSPYGAGNDAAMLYSNFALQFASSTLTSGKIFIGNVSNVATISSASYPSSTTINQILYSSSANNITGLTTANGGVLVTSNTGVPSILAGSGTTGTPLLATASGTPAWGAFALSLGGALTTAGALTTTGAFGVTFTFTNTTSVTFPTSGTLATTSGSVITVNGDSGSASPSSGILTISGGSTGLTTSGSGSTLNITGTLGLANGGTNHALTASAGGIVWSDASKLNILSGTTTANQILLSGNAATPSWSTSTYPSTNAINTLLYASAANTMSALATANSGVLVTSSTGVPSILAAGTTGQLLQASTSGTPSWTTNTFPNTDAKGDLLYASAANTIGGLAIGGTGTILTVSSGLPAWTTATYPATTTINQILYSSSANVVGGITTANSAMFFTNSSGVPAWTGSATNGQLLIGNTGGSPTLATLTASTNITITNAGGSITIATSGIASFSWTDVTGTSQSMAVNNGYIADNSSLVTLTLPSTAAQGTMLRVCGNGSGGWTIAQNASQNIKFGSVTTTTGTGGSLSSSNRYDNVELLCTVANTTWVVMSVIGNLTYV
jgi:hypothetical protein